MNLITEIVRHYGTHLGHPGHWRLVKWLVQTLRLDPGENVTITAQGLTWHLNPRDHVQKDLFWFGVKDRWDMEHLRRLINRQGNPVILDVGANFGYYSLLLAAHCRRIARIFAFEPAQRTADRLVKNIRANDMDRTIHVKRVALGAKAGESFLMRVEGDTGKSFLWDTVTGDEAVQVKTLDGFVAEEGLTRLDLIKLDVEGAEPLVLQGGRESLARWHPILFMELNPSALQRGGFTAEALLAELRSLGYRFLISRRRELVPLAEIPSIGEYRNVFCLPDGP